MIKWAIIFAIIGIIAGVLGFGGIAGAAVGIAKFLFWAGIITVSYTHLTLPTTPYV